MSSKDTDFSISEALARLKMSKEQMLEWRKDIEVWEDFGIMNSNFYRRELFRRFKKAGISSEEQIRVYYLFSILRTKDRVLKCLNTLKARDHPWLNNVKAFIKSQVSNYTSIAKKEKKFPGVKIPTTFPGMDMLCWIFHAEYETITVENFFLRTTSIQLKLDQEAQAKAKAGYRTFWENTVKRSKNSDSKDGKFHAPEMREEFYERPARDEYFLMDSEWKEVPGTSPDGKYSIMDIAIYLQGMMLKFEKAEMFDGRLFKKGAVPDELREQVRRREGGRVQGRGIGRGEQPRRSLLERGLNVLITRRYGGVRFLLFEITGLDRVIQYFRLEVPKTIAALCLIGVAYIYARG